MLEALGERDVPLLEPERREIRLGDATLEILPPPGDPTLGHNDNSVGVILTSGDFRASFTGDAERRLWEHWLETVPETRLPSSSTRPPTTDRGTATRRRRSSGSGPGWW